MFGIEKDFQNLMEQVYGPLNKDKMTEIEKVKSEIKVLEAKLFFLEELEKTKSPVEEAFKKAQQTENWKEIQRLIDEEDNDKNFKNSLDLIKEWGEKNKPSTLYEILWKWWEDIFTSSSDLDANASIDELVNRIDEQFIPPSHDTNDYQWNKCLKVMRDKLR